MKHILTLLLLFSSLSVFSQGGILNRAKQKLKEKAEQRAEEKIEEGIDKGLDEVENGVEGRKKKAKIDEDISENKKTDVIPAANTVVFESYSRYDFVPGAQVVYAEDFSQDVIGEFPLLWSTNNRGEVVTVKGQQGQWLRIFHGSHFVAPQLKKLPENFTVEFDMVLTFPNEGYLYPSIALKLIESAVDDKDGRKYLADVHTVNNAIVRIHPGEEGSSTMELSSQRDGAQYFAGGSKGLKKLDSYYGKSVHVAMWIQKSRFRMWINGEKIYDIPQAIPPVAAFNRLALEVTNCNYEDEQVGVYLSNIRIAEGAADVRNKLITEGKWSTNGILFDVASDKIKPESAGVLKEIASVLKENASVKVKIVGHTDSDGDDAKNMDLSKRRAAAVKAALEKEHGIDAGRMQTDGLGETKPVGPNTTKEGKSQNRRVEFIKL